MFAKQLPPSKPEQTEIEIQFPFTCSRCRKPSQTAFMCETCFNETDPTQKHDNLAWWDSPKKKSKKQRGAGRQAWLDEQKAKKAAKTFTELAGGYFGKQSDKLAPGWTERLAEFTARESQISDRQTWLKENATQLWTVQSWLYWLEEMDRIRISDQRWKELGSKKLDVVNMDLSDVREDHINHDAMNIFDLENEFREEFTQSQLKHYSRYTVFAKKVVNLLNSEEFAILQIYVHQIKINRAAHSNREYTSNDAAKALTLLLGRTITDSNYRKLVDKLNKTLEVENGLHISTWIEAGYL